MIGPINGPSENKDMAIARSSSANRSAIVPAPIVRGAEPPKPAIMGFEYRAKVGYYQ